VRLRDWLASGADGAYRVNGKPAPVQLKRAYVDPSAVSFSAQLRRDGWVKPREAENDVLDGIRYTATLLTSGRLCIHRSCAHLIRELTGYRWDAKAQERGEDSPVKADDHGVDALRYGCYSTRRYTRRWLVYDTTKEAA